MKRKQPTDDERRFGDADGVKGRKPFALELIQQAADNLTAISSAFAEGRPAMCDCKLRDCEVIERSLETIAQATAHLQRCVDVEIRSVHGKLGV
ncbi:MAG: hypothetical protein NTW87_11535 [Planctomycetota bacterium]|nr:hypothetical protein [Planctomycetota bacterium]